MTGQEPIDVSAQVAAILDKCMLDWQGVVWCKTCQDFLSPFHDHDPRDAKDSAQDQA